MEYSSLTGVELARLLPAFDGLPTIYDTTKLKHAVGQVVTDGIDYPGTKDTLRTDVPATRLHRLAYTESDKSVYADPAVDQPGYLSVASTSSPHVFPAGSYRAYFRLTTGGEANAEDVVATVSVKTEADNTLAQRDIHARDFLEAGKYQDFAVDFEKTGPENLNLRVYFTDRASHWARYVIITSNSLPIQWALALFWTAFLLVFTFVVVRSAWRKTATAETAFEATRTAFVRIGAVVLVLALAVVLLASLFPLPLPGIKDYRADELPHAVGRAVPDKDSAYQEAVFASPSSDKQGHMVYGPYEFFPSGTYTASFRIKTDDNSLGKTKVAVIEVAGEGGQFLASRDIDSSDFAASGKYQDFSLEFSTRQQKLEFRVYFEGQAAVWVDNVEIKAEPSLLQRLFGR